MTITISIELSQAEMRQAEEQMRVHGFASLSDYVEFLIRDRAAEADPLIGMKDEIRRRMELPDDQWIRMDENDDLFERIRSRMKARYGEPG
jgi:antitoxin ParD1/3/4